MITLSQIKNAVGGELLGGRDVAVNGISINTRKDCSDRIFIALKGENFDAHDFVDQAHESGACALMVERDVTSSLPTIKVANTHRALADLSTWWRSNFTIPVIGVTGSVGKTTVKEMLGFIFSQWGHGVVTKGNLNNEIGVPLTLMRLSKKDKYAVVEMGMNRAGEIARITKMARPTVAVINNAAAAHLEELGTVDAVARAKAEIFQGLSDNGVAIINNDDVYAQQWLEQTKQFKQLTFALENDADVTANYKTKDGDLIIDVTYQQHNFAVEVRALGEHNICNSLAAITAALAAGVEIEDIQAGLRAYRPVKGRLHGMNLGQITLIDDTYNANPLSMIAAINVLVQKSDNCLIVGDMAELGESAIEEHAKLGRRAAEAGVSKLFVCGEYASIVVDGFEQSASKSGAAMAFSSQDELIKYVTSNIHSGTVLVKGSRSARMEKVIMAFNQLYKNTSESERGHN